MSSGSRTNILAAAVLMMVGLQLFIHRTRLGKAMRATAQDKIMSSLVAISSNRIIAVTFAIGAGLAACAGVMVGFYYGSVRYDMGFVPGIKAFAAAVLGGIGNIPGAMLGGIFLGLIESVGPSLFLDGLGIVAPYQLKDAIAFTMLVMVLIFRPTGILGERLAVKKA